MDEYKLNFIFNVERVVRLDLCIVELFRKVKSMEFEFFEVGVFKERIEKILVKYKEDLDCEF